MDYVSTRGEAPALGLADALLAGLAPDGGLYVPVRFPAWEAVFPRDAAQGAYRDVATAILAAFAGPAFPPAVLRDAVERAYGAFGHAAITPLRQIGTDDWLLELFHGPTLAFKDVAMQVLGRLYDHVLGQRGRRATVIAATSGDTGAAAVEAFRGRSNANVVVLHPAGRISEVQRRQMTTAAEPNVLNIAVDGAFDDCQRVVKALFADVRAREEFALTGVNSINVVRILAQMAYYVAAAVRLGAPGREVAFVVPTGNFGNVLAGDWVRRLGLPIRLVAATNANAALARLWESGRFEAGRVHATRSPAMDIQLASNFERLLFEACGREPAALRAAMQSLAQSAGFELQAPALAALRQAVTVESASEEETLAAMRRIFAESGEIVDPHTAVGLAVARRAPAARGPMVTLATAHPAKFAATVREALSRDPDIPARVQALFGLPERYMSLPADPGRVAQAIRIELKAAA